MAKEKKIKAEDKKEVAQKAEGAKAQAKTASQIELEDAYEQIRKAMAARNRRLVESSLKNGTGVSYNTLRELAEATGDPKDWARVKAVEEGMVPSIADAALPEEEEKEKTAFEEAGVPEYYLMGKHASKSPRPSRDHMHTRDGGKRVPCDS